MRPAFELAVKTALDEYGAFFLLVFLICQTGTSTPILIKPELSEETYAGTTILLFIAVVFCEISANTDLVNVVLVFSSDVGRVDTSSEYSISSTNKYTNLILCVFH